MSVTEKISVTIARGDLRHARRLAARLGLSLSSFISDAVRERVLEQERREAAQAVLASFPADDRATAAEMAALLERWGAPARVTVPAAPPPRTRTPRARKSSGARTVHSGR